MKKKLLYLLAAAVFMAAVCAGRTVPSGAAPFDPAAAGSVTVYPLMETELNQEMAEDINKARIVVDIYQVATAEKTPVQDSYEYTFLPGFAGDDMTVPENADGWKALAQTAAKKVFAEPGGIAPVKTGKEIAKPVEEISPGLYLLIVRSEELTDPAQYQVKVRDQNGKLTGDIASIAHSPRYEYTFLPQLVSLPVRGDGNVTEAPDMTSDPGDWNYHLKVYLKPEQKLRYASLDIVKTLSDYETDAKRPGEPATFVFQVDGMVGDQLVYSKVESITFTAPGQERVRFDKIPVTARVTVTEIYGGSSYQVTSDAVQSVEVSADMVKEVFFTNKYDHRLTGGHGIRNRFMYQEAEGPSDSQTDTSSGGEGNIPDGEWTWDSDPKQSAGEDNG